MSLEHSQEYGAPSAVAVKREPTKEELERIAACFAVPYDDRVPRPADAPRLREVCEQFSVSIPTARKMLITAGMYSTHKSRQVIELLRQGKSIEEIIMLTGLKKSSINAYIPYRSELRGDPDIAASGDRRLKRKEAKWVLLEGLALENAQVLNEKIVQLQSQGFRASLDDFGSGFSSLNTLGSLQINELKLDRGFLLGVSALGQSRARLIMSQTVRIAKQRSIATVAEGVETAQDEELICQIGCDSGQGYLYSRPISAQEFDRRFMAPPDQRTLNTGDG